MSMSIMDAPPPGEQRRSHVVALGFYTEYEPDPNNPGEMVAKDYVKWGRRGDLQYTINVEKVDRVKKPFKQMEGGAPMPNPVWEAIRPAYEAWKSGQETPVNGIPLEAWPGLNHTQVRILRESHIRCVEDLAAVTDGDLPKVRLPKMRDLRDRAKAFLVAKEGDAKVEAVLASRDEKIANLEAQLQHAMAALTRLGEAKPAEEEAPRKRG